MHFIVNVIGKMEKYYEEIRVVECKNLAVISYLFYLEESNYFFALILRLCQSKVDLVRNYTCLRRPKTFHVKRRHMTINSYVPNITHVDCVRFTRYVFRRRRT